MKRAKQFKTMDYQQATKQLRISNASAWVAYTEALISTGKFTKAQAVRRAVAQMKRNNFKIVDMRIRIYTSMLLEDIKNSNQ